MGEYRIRQLVVRDQSVGGGYIPLDGFFKIVRIGHYACFSLIW